MPKTHTKVKHWDIFPKVCIKQGPGEISQDSVKDDSYINDDNTIIRPIIRNVYAPLRPIEPIIERELIEPEITKEKGQSEQVEPNTYFEEYAQGPNDIDDVIEALNSSGNSPKHDNLIKGDKQKELEINISVIEDNKAENGELIEQDLEENCTVINQREENNTAETHLQVNVNPADAEEEKTPDLKHTNDSTGESISYSPLVTREEHLSTDLGQQITGEANLKSIEDGDNCIGDDDKAAEDLKLDEKTTENNEEREKRDTFEDLRIEEVIEILSDDDQNIQKKDANTKFDLESHISNPLFPHISLMVEDEKHGSIYQSFSTDTEKFFTPNSTCLFVAKEPTSSNKIDIISQIILKSKNTEQNLNNIKKSDKSQEHFSRIEEVNTSLLLDSKPINVKRKPSNAIIPSKKIKSSSESTNSKKSTSTLKSSESKKSISEASKLRNLDGDFSTTSTSSGPKNVEISTSLSSASKKRNLDKVKSSSMLLNKKKIKKFVVPLRKRSSDNIETVGIVPKKSSAPSVFNYPSKLSQKAIRDAFFEQDKKFYESSGSSVELAKVWEERLKRPPRPTPKQIQQSTCLATIRKTNEGVEVIPTEKKNPRYASGNFLKSFLSPPSSVNMNIFSDRNAKTFERFIASDKKDYKLFNFNLGKQSSQDNHEENIFNFQREKSAEYTQTSQSWTFVRGRSDESDNAPISLKSTSGSIQLSANAGEIDFTNEGLFKRNNSHDFGRSRKFH